MLIILLILVVIGIGILIIMLGIMWKVVESGDSCYDKTDSSSGISDTYLGGGTYSGGSYPPDIKENFSSNSEMVYIPDTTKVDRELR